MVRNVIGEGSYGCVIKPSLKCIKSPHPGFDYSEYVSKIMKTNAAKDELAEFVIIGKIDPTNDYHLGEPKICKPFIDNPDVKQSISQCKNIKLNDIEAAPNNYSQLLIKYGGPDLKTFCGPPLTEYFKKDQLIKHDKFWLEVHHLFKGLKFFKDNGIIHNDVKPQNILFDTTTGKMKYIDFGLMRTKKMIIESSKASRNYLGIYHWSFPLDCGLMNADQYKKYKEADFFKRHTWKNTLSEIIISDSKNNSLQLPIKNSDAFKIYFAYINIELDIPDAVTQYGYINSFFNGFNQIINNNTYENVLNGIADSIDIFGLGFTLQFIANYFFKARILRLGDYITLSNLFDSMYNYDPSQRETNIDNLLVNYEGILLQLGITTRLGVSFENHNIVKKSIIPASILKENKIDEKSPPQYLSKELEEFANEDPLIITVNCPSDKEFNPLTKRCVKKCPPGFLRNEKFKCYNATKKNKTVKSKPASLKVCPSDKEFNPLTKRCVKKCPPGFLRNEKFKCRKKR
jgi:serine/threonine protein kinase